MGVVDLSDILSGEMQTGVSQWLFPFHQYCEGFTDCATKEYYDA